MAEKEIELDVEAEKLFREFGGIDTRNRNISYDDLARVTSFESRQNKSFNSLKQLSDSLLEEEGKFDAWRILLIELMHLVSSYFLDTQYREGIKEKKDTSSQIIKTLDELAKMPAHDGTILLRFRGFPTGPGISRNIDYVVTFGNITVDFSTVPALIKRLGIKMSHLTGQLTRSFEVFSEHGINNLYLNLPGNSSRLRELIIVTLGILARYNHALKTGVPIVFINKMQQKVTLPLVFNEKNQPDHNLTLMAGINGLKPQALESLLQKVGAWLKSDSASAEQFASLYDAIFAVREIQEKFIKPPIEVNNVKWLMLDRDQKVISKEKARVGMAVMDGFGNSPQKAARVMESVYGGDFEKINSKHFGEKLKLATDLLASIGENSRGEKILQEVLQSIQGRFDQVSDKVFDDISVQDDIVKIRSGEEETAIGNVDSNLLDMINIYKSGADSMEKMKAVISSNANFTEKDYEALARNFGISVQDAEDIIKLLKSCFDKDGPFLRGTFEKNIPKFAQYERKIFEFLWKYLKETPNRNDRVAFLNSLQMLITRMKQPKRALRVILADFCENPAIINFSDRNALMLAILFLRKYNKELNLDIELTPEEVLLVEHGLDRDVAKYTIWRIDSNQEQFFEKIKTVRRGLLEAIDSESDDTATMPVRYLLSLEREIHIFLALIGGSTARSVIRSAVKEYGNPNSEVYHLKESRQHITAILQHLRVAIRGLGRVGETIDLSLLEEVIARDKEFIRLIKAPGHDELIRQIMHWSAKSMDRINSL